MPSKLSLLNNEAHRQQGFRVELDGVAAAMETTPGVKVATAILIAGELWGFYAPKSVPEEDVKAATSRVQPHYAVPSHFVSVDKFPETANGKSDKRALEALAKASIEEQDVSSHPIPQPTVTREPVEKSNASVRSVDSVSTASTAFTAITALTASTAPTSLEGTPTSLSSDKKIQPATSSTLPHYEQDTQQQNTQPGWLHNLWYHFVSFYHTFIGFFTAREDALSTTRR
ncbi:hypothetical protein H0H81_007109 [Sphagnurus paluster]|uniref:AMP-binding enzyme C-terminal domain-containing protein n=1 Tax=Sphagnurus paluster TaxID=117069 RepID=A0A9P7FR95_9AGAR|nr:hypothetical protein H0H81_007109 [Sphagnurus paluster]